MKKMILFIRILTVSIFSLVTFSKCSTPRPSSKNSTNVRASSIKDMIESHHFTFVAETVNPLSGRFRNLTSQYDVSVRKDSVISYLPYFGRARTAPLDPSEGRIKFTSTRFSYVVTESKIDRWDITIKPEDVRDVQQLNFSIFDNGTANLNITSTSRDPISFNGRIK